MCACLYGRMHVLVYWIVTTWGPALVCSDCHAWTPWTYVLTVLESRNPRSRTGRVGLFWSLSPCFKVGSFLLHFHIGFLLCAHIPNYPLIRASFGCPDNVAMRSVLPLIWVLKLPDLGGYISVTFLPPVMLCVSLQKRWSWWKKTTSPSRERPFLG